MILIEILKISGITAFTLVVLWGEIAGTIHAFGRHGVAEGLIALCIPPVSWWRGIELYTHPTGVALAQGQPYPPLSAEELSAMTPLFVKATSEELSDEDVARFKSLQDAYARRTRTTITGEVLKAMSQALDLKVRYDYELGRCLLLALDQREPFISPGLENLITEAKASGLVRTAKLDADMRMLKATAKRDYYEDQDGKRRAGLNREQILVGLRRAERGSRNLTRLFASLRP
jgi:hypothetical protein